MKVMIYIFKSILCYKLFDITGEKTEFINKTFLTVKRSHFPLLEPIQ